jgi:type VI secretion system secreted protein Hcp
MSDWLKSAVAAAAVATTVAATAPAAAAVDAFLKIDGIQGEAADSKHRSEIDVLAWSWGVNQTATARSATGAAAGKAGVSDLKISKYVDKASVPLFTSAATGKHLKQAVLVVRKTGGKAPVEFIKVTLTDVIISSVKLANGTTDRASEEITLSYGKIKFEYTPQRPDGGADAPISGGYDVAGNKQM